MQDDLVPPGPTMLVSTMGPPGVRCPDRPPGPESVHSAPGMSRWHRFERIRGWAWERDLPPPRWIEQVK